VIAHGDAMRRSTKVAEHQGWGAECPAKAWNRRINRDGVKITWKFDRKMARRKFGYKFFTR
jgi:hypothetical protein